MAEKKAKVERVQFATNYYDSGAVKYAQGKHYPKTPHTLSQVAAGVAEVITVEVDADEHEVETAAALGLLKATNQATEAAEAAEEAARGRAQKK